jgi:hypothetical protein
MDRINSILHRHTLWVVATILAMSALVLWEQWFAPLREYLNDLF